ncbi:MAG: hypothetical protein JJT82_03135 [Legionellaceae bacterium]|nr:hypothetical protein [Legionellaceae bacterium]
MRKLVLWGHHPADYVEMFAVSKADLNKNILEFACGPSAINASLPQVVSADPLFVLDKDTLSAKTSLIFAEMVSEVQKLADHFDFEQNGGLNKLVWDRKKGMETFFADYELGLQEKRYIPVTNCSLPYTDFHFDFAFCSHYLFAGLDNQTLDFHVQVISELARVAKDVRIFPLIDRHGQVSELLGPVLLRLQNENFGVEVKDINYKLQKSGNAMLRVWAQQCKVE